MQEEFRPVTSLQIPDIVENRYSVSNFGNVFDYSKQSILNIHPNHGGYYRVRLKRIDKSDTSIGVHRLELLVFDYRPDHAKYQVNHIDGNPQNNMIYNLEWATPKENSDHAMLLGLHKMNGVDNPNNKLSEDQVKEICELIQTGKYYDTEIAKMYNVSYTNISDIHKGKIWTAISKNYNLNIRKPLKLTCDDVNEICKLLEENKYTYSELSRRFNVSRPVITAIHKGEIWTSISKNYNF